ncbi:MAG: hypothetical protein CM15mP21_4740 [Hyphomicrobiales bacterium]|nr:MAG: hypothetical protein CM15mP21_4740 [Hyphomicrobiales bacterium]
MDVQLERVNPLIWPVSVLFFRPCRRFIACQCRARFELRQYARAWRGQYPPEKWRCSLSQRRFGQSF